MLQSKPYNERILFLITVHDPAIIEAFEREKKYSNFTRYKYLLVGNHKSCYNSDLVIQCNLLRNNAEYYKNFLAYTGWFATVANKLIPDDIEYVCFLEYDTDLINVEDFNVMLKNVFIEDKEVYGMFNLPISNSFLDNSIFSKGLIDFLKANGYREIKPNNEKWIVSNNAIFKKDALHKFFECPMTINLLNYLNVDRMAGHFLERYLSVYCFIKNVEFGFINPCCFVHAALDSHNTQNRKDGPEGYERFKANYQISDKE